MLSSVLEAAQRSKLACHRGVVSEHIAISAQHAHKIPLMHTKYSWVHAHGRVCCSFRARTTA